MESIINIGTFIQQLTYYIKIGIYINKGTDKEHILEQCVATYNKYKTIETSAQISTEEETAVRKCLKRLNLVLKIDNNGNPLNIRNKEYQLNMIHLKPHPSLYDNDLQSMLAYATNNNITIIPDIPLAFILRASKYQDLMWQYTRSLFYISQLLISKPDAQKIDPARKKVFDEATEKLETILISISEIDERIKINEILTVDKFLNAKLVKTGINEKNVNEARKEVKEIFIKKGLGQNNSMTKMIDSISDHLSQIDLSKGNIIQNMFGIAQNVAQEMSQDLENDPDKFQNAIGAVTEVFQDAMDDSVSNNEEISPDLKNIFRTVLSSVPTMGNDIPNEELSRNLETIINSNGLQENDFCQALRGDDGHVDISNLDAYFNKMQVQ